MQSAEVKHISQRIYIWTDIIYSATMDHNKQDIWHVGQYIFHLLQRYSFYLYVNHHDLAKLDCITKLWGILDFWSVQANSFSLNMRENSAFTIHVMFLYVFSYYHQSVQVRFLHKDIGCIWRSKWRELFSCLSLHGMKENLYWLLK